MLSPSSPTQKNLSEEDSSGSDAGSEVSLEPETDRFGFILTNGSTAGSVGPPPELVRQREAKWINIIQQWDRIWSKKSSKVKLQCQKGIPASLRAKCWPLLCRASERMKQNENLYKTLDLQPALQSWVDVIERDLDRQFPFHEMFLSKDGHGQRGLFRVLKAYTQYQPEEGYCQAQGPVAAVLLMNMPAEEAFWCLVQISEQYLPGYYSPLLEGVLFDAAMLTWVLKRTCPAAHKHLQHHGVEPLMFATDWLMCLFTRHLPFNTLLRVWDLFFCNGVRVLLQVAVVLVRRVLGRAEQRKQCQGQMETLEKLRGVREQVQEEDDAFIAEVCSVPLSARDLEKRTEKELEKWRKDKPSSTFDPRGRCHGYHMAWTRAQQKKEARDREEREKGNLSVPIARSSSTLSLSPSLLHKKWRKGGKVSTGEGESGARVVRHLSMGAKEDWRSWTELNFEKVQDVQEEEDVNSEEHKKQCEPKLTGQTKERELLKEPVETEEIQNIPAIQIEESVTVTQPNEKVETRIIEKEESEMISQQTEETIVETEPNQSAVRNQSIENIQPTQPTENTSQLQKEEELDTCSQPQVEEEQNHQGQERENGVTDEETKKQEYKSDDIAAVLEKQSKIHKHEDADPEEEIQVSANSSVEHMVQKDMKPQEETEMENVQQRQVYTEFLETRTETCPDSETESNGEAPNVKDPDPTIETATETETIQQQKDVIKETDISSQGDVFEVKYQSTESLAEVEMTGEIYAQTETDTNVLAQHQETAEENAATQDEFEAEIRQIDIEEINSMSETKTEEETLIQSSPECIQQEDTDIATGTETEAEITATHDTVTESSKAFAPCSEKECDTEACKLTQEKAETPRTLHSEGEIDSDHTQAEETPTETLPKMEIIDSVEPPRKEEEVNLTSNSEERKSSVEIHATEEPVHEQPTTHVTMESTENIQENTVEEDDVFIPTRDMTDNTQAEDLPTETLPKMEIIDSVEPPRKEEEVNLASNSEERKSSVEIHATEEPVHEQPTTHVTMESTEDIQENTVEEDDVFIPTPDMTDNSNTDSSPQVQTKDSSQVEANASGLTQASGHRSSRSSDDFCVRRSSTSRGSRLARRLSEDLFITPVKPSKSQSIAKDPDVQNTEPQSNPGIINPTQTPPDITPSTEVKPSPFTDVPEKTEAQQEPAAPPKRFGLFRRLRGDQVKKAKEKETQKMQVPKILIQDFSDGTGKPIEEVEDEKLSSRERRKRRRDRERREKEEERLRKKKEKELEKDKERERRKPQTRGKSFQVQKEKGSEDVPLFEKTGSQTLRYSASYAESYF
ncbi:ecotropic viral integration site 5 ortholog [Channa argus]|uniref:ecotropic viral integration site 5 ortholog n=1 Tax=Channa argus TaxID=215402 RepID=UPI00294546A6|nr:hypothetical protein Q8A73_010853 [Channa argus]